MLFNSIDFAIFLPIVFILYWFVFKNKLKSQNILVVSASYLFYSWWDWRFLSLIIFSTLVDFAVGLALSKEINKTKQKALLWTSIFVNIGFLGFFKYFNFFLDNFISAFSFLGAEINPRSLNIILPVGISFYTFQTLSYTIDIYKKKLQPTTDLIAFSAFVSFFPQLVAGPIERASNLLPQFYTKRRLIYTKAIDGLRQILWGLFKKIVIADSCAVFVDDIFSNYANYSSSALILGAVLFAFQIYGDFSGYSDIAIGTAKLFGFNLMTNFKTPYFSRNIAEFWRRWHISLSTWFRDYLYIPIGGSKGSKINAIRNIFIVFIISGFWHGAKWTFIFWGLINAIYFIPSFLTNKHRKYVNYQSQNDFLSLFKNLINILITFVFTVLAWIFFRSESIMDAFFYIRKIVTLENITNLSTQQTQLISIRPLIVYILFFIAIEWYYRNCEIVFVKNIQNKGYTIVKYLFYLITSISILLSIQNEARNFIYFQF